MLRQTTIGVFALCNQFIKLILPLPSFFEVSWPSNQEPNVFPVQTVPQLILCPNCGGETVCHDKKLRRFRHGYAWYIGVLWIELFVPRQRCKECGVTFTYDYGLGLVCSSTEAFRRQIVKRCQGRSIKDVSCEYDLPYTTVERWFYLYAADQLGIRQTNLCGWICASKRTQLCDKCIKRRHRAYFGHCSTSRSRSHYVGSTESNRYDSSRCEWFRTSDDECHSNRVPICDSCTGSLSSCSIFYGCPTTT